MSDVSAPADLSIVIPTFNTREMTLTACRAALAARTPDTEIIVVDDASSDDTCTLLRRETPDVRTIRLERNVRFAGAANAGVTASTGRIVLLLNSDTLIDPGAPRAFLDAFAATPRLGIAGARLLGADGSLQWSGGPRPTLLWLLVMVSGAAWLKPFRRNRSRYGEVDWVSGAAMAIRRETWDAVGPFLEHYRFYAQDLDLCIRAGDAGWKVRVVEDALVVHAGGSTVKTTSATGGLPHDPSRLWIDLLHWGRECYGRRWARIALPAVRLAASLRIAARRTSEPFLPESARLRSRAATDAYVAARRCLTAADVLDQLDTPSDS